VKNLVGKYKRPQLSQSYAILTFYFQLLKQRLLFSILVIFLGFVGRALTVVVFVLVLKVFLSILEPESSVAITNHFLLDTLGFELEQQQVLMGLVSVLSVLIMFQFLINKLNLFLFLKLRAALLSFVLESKLNNHTLTHLNICLDKIPQGFDAVVKSSEIVLFYSVLLSAIFYLSPLTGFLVLFIVPSIVFIMLIKGRKEVHVQAEMHAKRKEIKSLDDDIDAFLHLNEQTYLYGRNSLIYADLLGGLAIISLILVFYFISPQESGSGLRGLAALFLVFSVRFAIVYAGELSRLLGRVLQQRVIIEKISLNPFKDS